MSRFVWGQLAIVVLLIGAAASAQAEDAPPAIIFRVEAHAPGVAKEPTERTTADKQRMLRVEGEKRKPTVRLYDASGKAIGPAIPQAAHRVTALAISPDQQAVATAVGNFSNDWGKVRVWDAKTGKLLAEQKGPPYLGEVFSLEFSADGKSLTISTADAGGK